jgi:transcriptional regulator with XRE-family HTH domain
LGAVVADFAHKKGGTRLTYQLHSDRLAVMVRTKQGTRGLREVSAEITAHVGSVSPSTLSRILNGALPDIVTFLHLCAWIEVSPAEFFTNGDEQWEMSTGEEVALRIRGDRTLEPAAAATLAVIVEAAYRELRKL